MKTILLFLFAILFFFSSKSQTVDSITVRILESNPEEDGWEFISMNIDSFSSGLKKNFLIKQWQNNTWKDYSLNSHSYDTSGNLSETTLEYWDTTQWENSQKWIHTYNANDVLLTTLIQLWNGSSWINKSIETHSLDANGTDTLIHFSAWRNSAWVDSIKIVRVFNAFSFLTEATSSRWDTVQGTWNPFSRYLHYPNAAGNDTILIYQESYGGPWENGSMSAYNYDSLENKTYYGEYWWEDTVWWLAAETIYNFNALHQLTGYSWDCFHGACGPAYGDYQYDGNGNLIYSHSYSETMGGIPHESRRHYYYFSYPFSEIYVFTVEDFEKCSADSALLPAFAIGGNPPLHYQWTPPDGLSSDTIMNPYVYADTSTVYTLTVTDSAGNSGSVSISVAVNQSPVAAISIEAIDSLSTCSTALLAADSLEQIWCYWYFNGVQQANPYGNYAAHFLIDENGFYKVRVRNAASSCYSYDSIEVNFLTHPAPGVTITNQCNTLVALGSGIQSYQWYKNDVIVPGAVYDTFSISMPDYYSVQVTDSSGCSNFSNRTYFNTMRVAITPYRSCGDTCTGSAYSYVYGAIAPFSYLWSNGDSVSILTNICAGIYTVSVTDARGCTVENTDSVELQPEIALGVVSSTIADSTICNGVSFATINGYVNASNYSYEWSNGSTLTSAVNLCSGWSYVTATSMYSHCTQVDSFFVSVNASNDTCQANASVYDPTCPGYCNGQAELSYSSGANPLHFFWADSHTGSVGNHISFMCPGNYSVLLIDNAGCADSLSFQVVEPDSIEGNFTILYANPNQPCSTLVGLDLTNDSMPTQIYWQCTGTTGDQAVLCPGICNVTVEDTRGCVAYFSIDVPDSIVGCSITSVASGVTCNGYCDGSATVIPNGVPPFQILWSTSDTGVTVNNLCPGTYAVTMQDSSGCTSNTTVTITEPPPLVSIISSSYLNCQCTFSANVTGGTPPNSYQWCNNVTTPFMNNCMPGICSLIITDANGCTLQDSVLITPPPPVLLNPVVSDATCNGCNDGSITSNASGGTPPFTYDLVPPGTSNTNGVFSGLVAGSYTLCVTDSNLCSVCTTLVVNQPGAVCLVSVIAVNNIPCFGECNGSLTAVANGVPPFNFAWSNGDSTATADSLCAGSYVVTMTDSLGCTSSDTAVITEPAPLVSVYTADFTNCNCVYTMISNGGTSPYTYLWCDGSIGQSISTCQPGLCPVLITDANGCLIVDTILMTPPPPLTLTVQTTGTSCIGCLDGTITSSASGGIAPYTFLVIPSQLNCSTCTNMPAAVYTVCVTDSLNCTICVTDTVEEDPTFINKHISGKEIIVYPNPFSSYVIFEIHPDLITEKPWLRIKDVLGREIFSEALVSATTQIDWNHFPPGIYFYELITETKKVFTGKIVATD